ncbi:MAG: hypothetical protein ACK47R_01305 [Planctomycetia bacterium]
MRNSKKLTGWIFGGVAFWGISATAWGAAAPTPSQILTFKPKQDGIQAVMPTAEEEASLKVELVKGAKKGSGWVLKDAQGNLLRILFDTNEYTLIFVCSY